MVHITNPIIKHNAGDLEYQGIFYVGNLKAVGGIYQQTFEDTYRQVALCQLYAIETSITVAYMLNDNILPVFEEQELPMLWILTDRGTEHCGRVDQHDY